MKMVDQAKNLMIGIFVVAAVTLIFLIILFIHPTVGDDARQLRVRFANIDKVNVGTRVNFAGRPIGEVIEIREILDEHEPRPTFNGIVYPYELTLTLDSSVEVYNSDEVSLRTSGLLGEKSVNIRPMPPKPGVPLQMIQSNEIVYADESGGVEETLREFKELSDKFEEALDSIIVTLHDFKDEQVVKKFGDAFNHISVALDDIKTSEVVQKFAGTFEHLRNITDSLDEPEKWRNSLNNVDTFTTNMVKTWDTVDIAMNNLADTTQNTRVLTQDGKDIIANVRAGEGTVGKVVMTDDLYIRLTSLLSKGETALNDVNHYGILFHLDKNWQRLRARRMNLLMRLSSPQEFRNFFNEEVDQISTSLSRVTMVLDESGSPSCMPCLIQNPEFTKVFSELLRRVEDVEEYLKLYNTQLNDCNVRETEFYNCWYPCYRP
jgi:phospholipid/cholesterol/gamma-HCH transport system substrate-binding protein